MRVKGPESPFGYGFGICINPVAKQTHTKPNATSEVAGIVRIQAHTILSTSLNFSALKRFAQPTPMMLVVIAWVVLTGIPRLPVTAKTVAAVVSAAKPCTG